MLYILKVFLAVLVHEFRATFGSDPTIITFDFLRLKTQLGYSRASIGPVTYRVKDVLRPNDSGELAYLEYSQIYFSVRKRHLLKL